MQQLGVGRDEGELLVAGEQGSGSDDLVAVGQRHEVPLVAVAQVVGLDPLDHARAGAECEAGAVVVERHERERAIVEVQELAQRDAALQVRCRRRGRVSPEGPTTLRSVNPST